MIIETIDIDGDERIINVNFITNIERTVVKGGGQHHPCYGVEGDQLIRLYMSTGQVIEIACDPNGDDVTEGVLEAYKSMMYTTASQANVQ
jgi:hypothetical protein